MFKIIIRDNNVSTAEVEAVKSMVLKGHALGQTSAVLADVADIFHTRHAVNCVDSAFYAEEVRLISTEISRQKPRNGRAFTPREVSERKRLAAQARRAGALARDAEAYVTVCLKVFQAIHDEEFRREVAGRKPVIQRAPAAVVKTVTVIHPAPSPVVTAATKLPSFKFGKKPGHKVARRRRRDEIRLGDSFDALSILIEDAEPVIAG